MMLPSRANIVAVARSWIGTPYVHQQSKKAVGTDCLGLVRGVYREFYGKEPEKPPTYSASWAEFSGRELMFEAAQRNLVQLEDRFAFQVGDVLLFRMQNDALMKHCAIVSSPDTIIHAYSYHDVMETALQPFRRRIAASFQYPGVLD